MSSSPAPAAAGSSSRFSAPTPTPGTPNTTRDQTELGETLETLSAEATVRQLLKTNHDLREQVTELHRRCVQQADAAALEKHTLTAANDTLSYELGELQRVFDEQQSQRVKMVDDLERLTRLHGEFSQKEASWTTERMTLDSQLNESRRAEALARKRADDAERLLAADANAALHAELNSLRSALEAEQAGRAAADATARGQQAEAATALDKLKKELAAAHKRCNEIERERNSALVQLTDSQTKEDDLLVDRRRLQSLVASLRAEQKQVKHAADMQAELLREASENEKRQLERTIARYELQLAQAHEEARASSTSAASMLAQLQAWNASRESLLAEKDLLQAQVQATIDERAKAAKQYEAVINEQKAIFRSETELLTREHENMLERQRLRFEERLSLFAEEKRAYLAEIDELQGKLTAEIDGHQGAAGSAEAAALMQRKWQDERERIQRERESWQLERARALSDRQSLIAAQTNELVYVRSMWQEERASLQTDAAVATQRCKTWETEAAKLAGENDELHKRLAAAQDALRVHIRDRDAEIEARALQVSAEKEQAIAQQLSETTRMHNEAKELVEQYAEHASQSKLVEQKIESELLTLAEWRIKGHALAQENERLRRAVRDYECLVEQTSIRSHAQTIADLEKLGAHNAELLAHNAGLQTGLDDALKRQKQMTDRLEATKSSLEMWKNKAMMLRDQLETATSADAAAHAGLTRASSSLRSMGASPRANRASSPSLAQVNASLAAARSTTTRDSAQRHSSAHRTCHVPAAVLHGTGTVE